MSFGDADLRFNDDGFIRVSGINENPLDNAGSNGSGKSSLWEAIVWVLTGETIRGTKQIVNLYGDDGCFVDIEFYIDKTRYQLIRSKDHKVRKTNLQILINSEDCSGKGIRDSEKLLQQYLPDLTASLLGSVIILGQGLPQKFTNNTPSGRKEVLEKLSKSDFMIDDLKQRVADRKATLTKDQRSLEDGILSLNTQKNILVSQISGSEKTLESLNPDLLNSELAEQCELLRMLEDDLELLRPRSVELNEAINKAIEEEKGYISEQNNELSAEKLNHDNTCSPHIAQLSELKAQLNVYNAELNRIKAIKDICPTCGQKITSVHKPDTTELEHDIQEVVERINSVNSVLKIYEEKYNHIIKCIQVKYQEKRAACASRSFELSSEFNKVKAKLKDYEGKHSHITAKIAELEKQIAQLESTIQLHQKIIIDNNEKINKIDEDLMYNNMQKDLTQSHLEVISKFDTALKRDFRGYLLSTVISYIESRAKQYCKVIFDTTNIGFCLDGNNIDISYMNKAYENLSGGEKQKVDLIIQFSIRDMLSSQLNFTSNILVLDEVFDGLDTIGCNRVIDMISNLSDVKNVFIVTHRKDLSIPSDKELIVVKSSVGISEMRQ